MIEQIGDLVLDLERMRADVADCLREPASPSPTTRTCWGSDSTRSA